MNTPMCPSQLFFGLMAASSLGAHCSQHKELPQLRSYLKMVSDDIALSHDEKMERAHAILLGWNQVEPGKTRNGT